MIDRLLQLIKSRQILSLSGNIMTAAINFLTFAVLVRMLEKETFGDWVLFLATYSILDQIRTGLLQSGIIKFYNQSEANDLGTVLGSAWYVSLILTIGYVVVTGVLYLCLIPFYDAVWISFLPWLGIMSILSLPMNFATWHQQAVNQFDRLLYIRLIQNGIFMLSIIGLAIFKFSSASTLLIILCYGFSFLCSSIYCLAKGEAKLSTYKHKTIAQSKELYHFGKMIIGSSISSSLLNYSNILIISMFLGPAKVAIFSLPQKFLEFIEIILRSFVATAQPTIAEAYRSQNKQAVANAFCKYTGTITLLIAPIIVFLMIFTEPLIYIIAGKDYLDFEGTMIVRITLITAILWPIDRFNGITLDMVGFAKTNLIKNLLKLILNVVFAVVLVLIFPSVISVAIAGILNVIFAIVYGYRAMNKIIFIRINDILVAGWEQITLMYSKFKNHVPK